MIPMMLGTSIGFLPKTNGARDRNRSELFLLTTRIGNKNSHLVFFRDPKPRHGEQEMMINKTEQLKTLITNQMRHRPRDRRHGRRSDDRVAEAKPVCKPVVVEKISARTPCSTVIVEKEVSVPG